MQRLAAAVCVIATTHEGVRSAFTATAVMSVSDQPPTLVAGINRRNHAHGLLLESRMFSVNVLGEDQRTISDTFAGRTELRAEQRFASGDWVSGALGCPVLRSCLASFECELIEAVETGTHTLVVGHIQELSLPSNGRPLLYWGRDYSGICDLSEAHAMTG